MGVLMNQNERNWVATAVYTVFFLFFFQLLVDFVAAIYAFGLLGTSIPPEMASVLFLFAPILLLVWRIGVGERPFLILSVVILISRLVEVLLDTRGQMLVSGLGVAACLIWLPTLLWRLARRDDAVVNSLVSGLVGGVLLSILLCSKTSASG